MIPLISNAAELRDGFRRHRRRVLSHDAFDRRNGSGSESQTNKAESKEGNGQMSQRTGGVAAWITAVIVTLACLAYQDRTGPTYPLRGSVQTDQGRIAFVAMRSQTIGRDVSVVILDPVPEGLKAQVRYRRYRSHDDWMTVPMERGSFAVSGRGRAQMVSGIGAILPSLQERAGKYEYFLEILRNGGAAPVSVTGDRPIYARYKAAVPGPALVAHIVAIFVSMLVAIRTTLAGLLGHGVKRYLYATIATLLLGGFVLGPLVQWYAFGVWWSGFPFGYDWTDNKVVVGLAFWLVALWRNRGDRRCRTSVVLAGIATLAIYFIPHSVFGSEYDYVTSSGHGTAG